MNRIRNVVLALAFTAALAGCAAGPGGGGEMRDLPTSSDQTDIQKRAKVRLELAVGYYEQHQLTTALDEVKRALQIDPNYADAYSVRALIYMDMNETRLAEEGFQYALKLRPNNPDFANNYGWFLCQNDRAAESIPQFESALKNRAYQSPAKALNNAGVCSLKLKDETAAERYFTEAFRYDTENVTTNVNLARLHFQRRDYPRAKFYINRAVKSDTANAEALWLGVKIERKLGDRAAEATLATQLRRRFPTSTEYAAFQRGAFDE
ncbi:MAG: type IV pilus biogenesis/stability protein PilW [Proteobacteria bacterium]|nr:type IV pilus biogenesis/stability protein PilW [Pseudomonadota bacterium]